MKTILQSLTIILVSLLILSKLLEIIRLLDLQTVSKSTEYLGVSHTANDYPKIGYITPNDNR